MAGHKDANGLTPKQLAFCRAYVETGNATEAYRRSFDAKAMKSETINKRSYGLMQKGTVRAMIASATSAIAERHEITIDNLVNELAEARAMAREDRAPAAMVSATMGKAKMLGLIVDRSSVSFEGRAREMTDDELRASIARIIKG